MSIQLTLKAENATEQRVLEYLQENASAALAAKINAGDKTLAGCLDYAKEQARKMANGASCLCVDDATVYGWIIHFFEEDDIKEGEKPKAKVRTLAPPPVKKPEPKPEPKKTAKPSKDEGQLTLFEALLM